VTLPYFLSKEPLSLETLSMVVSFFGPLSVLTTASFPGTTTGTTSFLNTPSSWALRARWWESTANSSCSWRDMPMRLARISAVCPMSRPVAYSETAGRSGSTKSRGVMPLRCLRVSLKLLGLWYMVMSRMNLRKRLETLMSASEKLSTPPMTITSALPVSMRLAPLVKAALADTHAMVQVCAGTFLGSPAPRATSRATLVVAMSVATHPMRTWSMSSGETPVFARSPLTAYLPSSHAMMS